MNLLEIKIGKPFYNRKVIVPLIKIYQSRRYIFFLVLDDDDNSIFKIELEDMIVLNNSWDYVTP